MEQSQERACQLGQCMEFILETAWKLGDTIHVKGSFEADADQTWGCEAK